MRDQKKKKNKKGRKGDFNFSNGKYACSWLVSMLKYFWWTERSKMFLPGAASA